MTAEFIGVLIIAIMAVIGLVFNSGVLYNDVRHLKKSVDDIWGELNEIKKILIERKTQ